MPIRITLTPSETVEFKSIDEIKHYCKANTDNKEKIAGILFDQRNLTLLTVLVKNALDIKHLAETFPRHQTALIDFALTAKNFDPKNSTVLVKHFSELEAIAWAFRSNEHARATIAALVLSEANLPYWQSQSTISDFSTEHHLALAMPWCTARLKPADKELETFQHEVVQLGIESFLDDSKLFPLKV